MRRRESGGSTGCRWSSSPPSVSCCWPCWSPPATSAPNKAGRAAAGVRRLNRLPLVIVSAVCLVLLAVLVAAGYQRAQQGRAGGGLGRALENRLEPVAAGQAARDLLRDYRESPPEAEEAEEAPFPVPTPPPIAMSHPKPEPLPDRAMMATDRNALERLDLAQDAHSAPTLVPTDDLYRRPTPAAGAAQEPAMAVQGPLPERANPAEDPNLRERKERFRQTKRHYGYSSEPRRPPPAPYIVRAGSVIPAVLITGLNSDLPGEILAQVSHDVRDSRSGRQVLIPRGAKLVGVYDHHVAMGQARVMVAWHRLQYPDDSTLALGGMAGVDAAGYTGFRDRVDNHYAKIFGSATLLAFIGAGVQLAIPNSGDDDDETEDPAETLQVETARQWGEVGRELVRRNLKIQPTLRIRPGYRFNVMVDKDLILPPYHGIATPTLKRG